MILSQENINSSDLIEVGRLIDLYANMAKTDSKSALISVDDLIPRSVVKVNEFGEETIVQDITDLTKSILELGKEFDKFSQLRDKIVKRIVTKEFNTVFEKILKKMNYSQKLLI